MLDIRFQSPQHLLLRLSPGSPQQPFTSHCLSSAVETAGAGWLSPLLIPGKLRPPAAGILPAGWSWVPGARGGTDASLRVQAEAAHLRSAPSSPTAWEKQDSGVGAPPQQGSRSAAGARGPFPEEGREAQRFPRATAPRASSAFGSLSLLGEISKTRSPRTTKQNHLGVDIAPATSAGDRERSPGRRCRPAGMWLGR